MDATVKTALESLISRELTPQEVASIDILLPVRNDVAIADILSTGRTRPAAVTKSDFQMWAGRTGVRAVIEDHARDDASPLRSIALTVLDFIRSNVETIDFRIEANMQMLMAWVQVGAITQEAADSLLTLGVELDPIHFNTVSDTLNKSLGVMTL